MTVSLIDRADRNLALHSGWIQRQLPGMTCRDDLGLQLADSGLPCDTFNIVCHTRLTQDLVPGGIVSILEHFGAAGRPFSWWCGPGDQPRDLDRFLTDAGLAADESEVAMAANLDFLSAEAASPDPTIRIARVRTADDLERFAGLLAANWDPPDQSVLVFYRAAADLLLTPDCPIRLYLAWSHEQAVGTAEVTVGGGVAGLYNVATATAHRGRGIGSLLVTRPLMEARMDGIDTGILQAASGAQSLYQRLGFRSFGSYTEYKLSPRA